MSKIMDNEGDEILRVLETLPLNWITLDWVKLMVGAWNEATSKVRARCDCGLTVSDQHEIANALLLADKRSCCKERRMGGRDSRITRIRSRLECANESLWKLDFSGFQRQCEQIEECYRKSTVYEALRTILSGFK